MIISNNKWQELLNEEIMKPYFKNLLSFLYDSYKNEIIYPEYLNIFKIFELADYDKVKVVILGQDPYSNGQAHGLAFSVQTLPHPPSLKNIFKEIKNEYSYECRTGDLSNWAKQGVFLLNTFLTVKKGEPLSHQNIGWEIFTNKVIELLNNRKEPVVFLFWGNYARKKKELITGPQHLILESGHPSPLSCKYFFGNNHFIKCNQFLKNNNIEEINWQL